MSPSQARKLAASRSPALHELASFLDAEAQRFCGVSSRLPLELFASASEEGMVSELMEGSRFESEALRIGRQPPPPPPATLSTSQRDPIPELLASECDPVPEPVSLLPPRYQEPRAAAAPQRSRRPAGGAADVSALRRRGEALRAQQERLDTADEFK